MIVSSQDDMSLKMAKIRFFITANFYDQMHDMKNPDQCPRQILVFLMSTNFLKNWLDQYATSDNICELDTKLSLTFILISYNSYNLIAQTSN